MNKLHNVHVITGSMSAGKSFYLKQLKSRADYLNKEYAYFDLSICSDWELTNQPIVFFDEFQFTEIPVEDLIDIFEIYSDTQFYIAGLTTDCFGRLWYPFADLINYASTVEILTQPCSCKSGLLATFNRRSAGHGRLIELDKRLYDSCCINCWNEDSGDKLETSEYHDLKTKNKELKEYLKMYEPFKTFLEE